MAGSPRSLGKHPAESQYEQAGAEVPSPRGRGSAPRRHVGDRGRNLPSVVFLDPAAPSRSVRQRILPAGRAARPIRRYGFRSSRFRSEGGKKSTTYSERANPRLVWSGVGRGWFCRTRRRTIAVFDRPNPRGEKHAEENSSCRCRDREVDRRRDVPPVDGGRRRLPGVPGTLLAGISLRLLVFGVQASSYVVHFCGSLRTRADPFA